MFSDNSRKLKVKVLRYR